MADLLIKNMKMPDCCYGCPLVYDMGEGNYACPFFNGYAPIDGRRDDCPLVEVKPHGDLKDANIIMQWLNLKADNRVPVTVGEIIDFIEEQPTVLEASEGTGPITGFVGDGTEASK